MSQFSAALGVAEASSTSAWLDGVYRDAFLDVASIARSESGKYTAQDNGVDVVILLKRDKVIRVEEKIRTRDFGDDVLLELKSNEERKTPGWLLKPYTADFIAYAVPSSGRCLLLPVLLLRRAWKVFGPEWYSLAKSECDGFKLKRGETHGTTGCLLYRTLNIAVPTVRLLAGIGDACRASMTVSEPVAPTHPVVKEVIDGFVF
jgi:hypothetical protein